MNNKEDNITTDLLMRNRDKFLVIGNVAFKLKNLWYYFYIRDKKR